MNASERDWPEDFEYENGIYMNTCAECGNTFTGHKRRVTCKSCHDAAPVPELAGEIWARPFSSNLCAFDEANKIGRYERREVNGVMRTGYSFEGKFYFHSATSAFGVIQSGFFYVEKENEG